MVDSPCVLVIDDEPDIRELVQLTLGRMNIDCVAAENLAQAHELLNKYPYFLCLADMRLPDGDGIDFVKHIQKHKPELPVAVITAYGNVEGAVNTLKAGAFDYVSKPVNLKMLRDLVNTALVLSETNTVKSDGSERLIGNSAPIISLRNTIEKLSRSQAPVFIYGESGVGKELVARLIHDQGPRVNNTFVPVNCGAIPTELMESEFFGHCKGSFSGAVSDKQGLFQVAAGGTLFLDEIADLPLQMQVKLLRAIQEKAIRPIGGQREIPVDVRILSASHKDLLKLVEQDKFRKDLYYRINVITVSVPNLQQRSEDIPLLTEHLLDKIAENHGVSGYMLSKESMKLLTQHVFVGNIRELENILERACTLCENGCIEPEDLQLPTQNNHNPVSLADNLEQYLDEHEKQKVLAALEQTNWNRTKAAKNLGITLRAMRYRLKKWGLERSS